MKDIRPKMPTTDPLSDRPCPIRIPDHELLRLIGKGSYGEVWLGRNIMGSFRAVKIIRRSFFDNQSPFDREFAGIKKFEPISRTHSGFVDILQIGRNDEAGCLYYVMEAADDLEHGQSIQPDTYIPKTLGKALGKAKRFPVEQCVQMGLALCQALDTLHKHGLVHRDIKPSNIVFINGVPKLADIGLVTESENARSFVGTEGFIPPEGPGSARADIYSLGKALYEIASGRDRLDFPALPPQLAEFEDGEQFLELNECLLRACRLDAQKRYSSAREMYEDLALLASGKSLRRLRTLERRWQNVKRTAAVTAGVMLAIGAIAWPLIRERQHKLEIRERQIGVRSASGIIKLDQGDMPGALREFAEVFQLQSDDKEHYAVNQTRVASILANNPRLVEMVFLKGRASSVEISADGKRMLAVERQKQTRFCDLATGEDLAPPLPSSTVLQASLSPDAKRAVIADESGWAAVWNLADGKTDRLEHPANVMCARFSPSGNLIATACKDGMARIWDARSLSLIFELRGHTGSVRSVAFSPDERLLASTATDRAARLWDVRSGQPVGAAMIHPSWVTDVAFNPDSSRIVTAGSDNWARVWKVGSHEEVPTLMKHDDVLTRVGYSPDGAMILTASNDATLRLWEANTTQPLSRHHVLRHSAGVISANFHANGHQIVTGCLDGAVRVWDLAGAALQPTLIEGVINDSGTMSAAITSSGIRVQSLSDEEKPSVDFAVEGDVQALALSATGDVLAAHVAKPGLKSPLIQVWRGFSNNVAVDVTPRLQTIASLHVSPDGSLLVAKGILSGANRNVTLLFDTDSGSELPVPDQLSDLALVAFHPTKRAFAIGSGQRVNILDAPSCAPLVTEISVAGDVRHLTFSANGQRLLVSQNDGQINPRPAVLIDVATGKGTGTEFWHRDGVLHGAFSPDGARVVTGGEDREVLIWDAGSPTQMLPPLLHRQQVHCVNFTPDGRWIGTVSLDSLDSVARIWDSATGFPITPPLRCERNQHQIILLPDGLRFATVQSRTRAWLWTLPRIDLSPEDAIAISHLLNADRRSSGPTDTQRIADSWSTMKQKFPDLFQTTPKQAAAWHAEQYRAAESKNEPVGMAFHRSRLETLGQQPDSPLDQASLAGKSK
jgi:WD40 repeat protein